MRLSFGDGRLIDVLEGGAPLEFPGEADIHADCLDGETIDLNVMTRRDRFAHTVDRVSSAAEFILPPGAGTRAIFFTAPATVVTAEMTVEARRFDTAFLSSETTPVTVRADAGLDIFVITLRPLGKGA
jgi:environmental stress-induced protein Ves